jgi:hypothetical protein
MITIGINTIRNIKLAKKTKDIFRFIITYPSWGAEPPVEIEEILKMVRLI